MKLAEMDNITLQSHVMETFKPPDFASNEFTNWIEQLILNNSSPNTVYAYAQTVSEFLKFAKKPVSQMSESDVAHYARHLLSEGKSVYTIQEYLIRVGVFLKAMGKPINVYKYAPKKETEIPQYLTKEEVKKFLNAINESILDDDEPDPQLGVMRFKTLFTLLVDTGLRASEACNLVKKDIDFNERLITVRKSKRKKTRNVPVSQSTLDMLVDYWGKRTDKLSYAFEYKGRKLDRMIIWRYTKKIAKEAGIDHETRTHGKEIYPHMFRHTFATLELKRLIREGNGRMDALLIIKEALGHADIKTTLIYLTLLGEDIRDMMGR